MEKLKPCPFCGGKAVAPSEMNHHVLCSECGASGANWAEYSSAIEAWNKRYERTCHAKGDWFPVSQTQWRRIDKCSNCGYGFGVSERDNMPFEIERIAELPKFCPQCGFEVCMDDAADGEAVE